MFTSRAGLTGLHPRPLPETRVDTAAYEEVRDVPRQAGLTDGDQGEILRLERAWG